ncbi:UPF0223 family protein [Falsibacillus albus]|uniref:UPF0223 protein D9X91_09800 n=1 Tax=Falsibacillus albus TaxID=2478915 RepID=A0A3L7JZE7_9BACI|nr:UPF0223 family protein [Falsibacillus albus]RLQ95900.1 UPF0223 family protein [Falsibacillus albus]
MEYQYPFSYDWTTDEVIDVIKFFETIEKAYEKGVSRDDVMSTYRRFKEIVPSKSEEKQLCKEFEQSSGYSSYHVVKKTKEQEKGSLIKM